MDWTEWLDRNTITPDKKLLVFLLAFLASSLILVTKVLSEWWVAIIFLIPFALLLIALLWLVRQQTNESWKFKERKLFQSRWGTFGISALGFGLGALVYHYRAWLVWLWVEFRKIDKLDEWTLVSLFLLGVILGFFVVRNWSKDQKDFITSLTAVFGAAFVSTILGQLSNQSGSVLTPQNSFALYALGFTLSGALNLLAFSMLVAHYTGTQSLTSRSVIDFLYGSDKAQAIDLYFLKNFEADPNYAKEKLVAALSAYREIITKKLARAMNERMKEHEAEHVSAPSNSVDATQVCPDAVSLPFKYFELISIKSIQRKNDNQNPPVSPLPASPSNSDNQMVPPVSPASASPPEDTYEIVFRRLRRDKPEEAGDPITPDMFRVAISMRWLDNLEYVVSAGEYKQSFPYYGSVAGMSLLASRTIVMNRDQYKKFRTDTFLNGKTPSQADQPRGLYEIDYLSYICVPMASSLGKPEEQSLGVLHAATKLFACPKDELPSGACQQTDGDLKQEIYRIIIQADPASPGGRLEEKLQESLKELTGYACNLYVQNDTIVTYLENMRGVIIPLLELYKKCRTGAINETKPAA
jgi:hypothetical protein